MSRLILGKLNISDGLQMPNVTTGNRPVLPVVGSIIYNTTTSKFEKWTGTTWISAVSTVVDATGGTIGFYGNYKIHIFTTVGTSSFTVISGSGIAEALVVAGGGGGGMDMGGGGGGGGMLQGEFNMEASSYSVVVGRGGYGAPAASGTRTDGLVQPGGHQYTVPSTNGLNSSVGGLIAIGGGGGGSSYYGYSPGAAGASGGSGGGASGYSDGGTRAGGTGTVGSNAWGPQGYNGGQGGGQYYSGGGGGAGGKGHDSTYEPHGGPGRASDFLGKKVYFSGGGGGGGYSTWGGNGGIGGGGGGATGPHTTGGDGLNPGSPGGGGNRSTWTNTPGGNAGANTGGGGGGSSHYNSNNKGGEGGSGIVVIRYKIF